MARIVNPAASSRTKMPLDVLRLKAGIGELKEIVLSGSFTSVYSFQSLLPKH